MGNQIFKIRFSSSEVAKFEKAAKKLVGRTKETVIKTAVRNTMKPVLAVARAKAPMGKTGMLRKAIKLKVIAYKKNGFVDGVVGVSRIEKEINGRKVKPSKYAHLVEFGSGPKAIKKAKGLSDGETFFGLKAGGSPPQPFLRSTFDSQKASMELNVRDEIGRGIEQIAKTLKI